MSGQRPKQPAMVPSSGQDPVPQKVMTVHHLLLVLAATPTPSPSPTLRPGLSEDQVTPGMWGFIMTAFFVIATTLLIVDMVRRVRRVRYRAQVEEQRMAASTSGEAGTERPSAAGRTDAEAWREINGDAGRTEP